LIYKCSYLLTYLLAYHEPFQVKGFSRNEENWAIYYGGFISSLKLDKLASNTVAGIIGI